MKAIFPDGNGFISFQELPRPELFEDGVLCRVTRTLISPGTEKMMINTAKQWSQEEIVAKNYRIGYNGVGIVEESANGSFAKGDHVVFYGGPYVSHSEYVVVPPRLVYTVPAGVPEDDAVFMGLGAIALHGFRKGKATLGDFCFVAGAGVVGNLAAQMAAAAGCQVLVSDLSRERLDKFLECLSVKGTVYTSTPTEADSLIEQLTGGIGGDTVLLCMSTKSADPLDQAVRVVRPGGTIVVVGEVDIHVPRWPYFYKEAELQISRAAGPGRYDPGYERERDYPVQYARWTEGRNCGEVLRQLQAGLLNVSPLVDDTIPVSRAEDAYRRILDRAVNGTLLLDWEN
jgi:threonine dehydrogenase-like Zn-dependent dehydrogenase